MKRLLSVAYIVAAVVAAYWGIMWLEDMRKESAEASRQEAEAVLREAEDDWLE